MTGKGRLAAVCLGFAIAVAACREAPPPDAAAIHHKPTAPVSIYIDTKRVSPGVFKVIASATPSEDTRSLEILVDVDGVESRTRFHRVLAGEMRVHTTTVRIGAGAVVRASARTLLRPGFAPNRVTEVTVGTPPPRRAAQVRQISLPTGEIIEEVR